MVHGQNYFPIMLKFKLSRYSPPYFQVLVSEKIHQAPFLDRQMLHMPSSNGGHGSYGHSIIGRLRTGQAADFK